MHKASQLTRFYMVWVFTERHFRRDLSYLIVYLSTINSLSVCLLFCYHLMFLMSSAQKQTSRGVLRKRCSENIQQIYRRTPMPKCDFNKVATKITLRHGCSPVNLLHIFRTPFIENTSGRLLLSAAFHWKRN